VFCFILLIEFFRDLFYTDPLSKLSFYKFSIVKATMTQFDIKALKKWFKITKRDLPWRRELSPYQVWVSEVMLQQTQVKVVIPYFERWMDRFPTLESLAEAPLSDVIKLWEGLGYYSRARNLHEGAKYILKHHAGTFPSDPEQLIKIKGIGEYTCGAILNFAFHKKAPAIDGNVIRVITRHQGIKEDVVKLKTQHEIRRQVESLLPDHEPWIISEALIELGATICQKKPKCQECPLKLHCHARLHAQTDFIPFKSTKIKIETLHRAVAVITCNHQLLLQKGEKGAIMHDLHEFPYFESSTGGMTVEELTLQLKNNMGLNPTLQEVLPIENHSFTRFKVCLYPHLYTIRKPKEIPGYSWIAFKDLDKLAFSSGHRRILETLSERLY
jgi:A/G-specific adenine glycosylase